MNLYIFNEEQRGLSYGVVTYIGELTAAIRNSEINVCVVNLWSNKPQILLEDVDGVKYWHFPAEISEQRTTDYQKQKELYYSNVVYLLKLYIVDVKKLIFHLNYSQTNSLAENLKNTFNCKIIYAVHGFFWCFTLLGNVTRFRKILEQNSTVSNDDELKEKTLRLYREEKVFFETADKIICLSQATCGILQDCYQIEKSKMTVVYNGLRDRYVAVEKTAMATKPNCPVILFAGRFDDVKGLAYAIRAFKLVLNNMPQCRFVVAGKGDFDKYMKECEDIWMNVTWTGLIDKEKLYRWYSMADIGVIPSFIEQCSYVAIEMMMHGLPVITSNAAGLAEMTVDGVSGLQVPIAEYPDRAEIDEIQLADKMLYLLNNPEAAKKIGNNARKRYEEFYSDKIFRKNMINFYKTICAT